MFCLCKFRYLTYIAFRKIQYMMIIVVSDIHLGYSNCNKDLFEEFIDSKLTKLDKTDHLILLGVLPVI